MKIKIPFKMFGCMEGEIEMNFPSQMNTSMEREQIEENAKEHAEKVACYLGVFRDELQRVLLEYERCPGIESVYQTLIDCDTDEVLRERLLELMRERLTRRMDVAETT